MLRVRPVDIPVVHNCTRRKTTNSDEVMTLRMLVYLCYSTTAEKVLTRSSLSALGNIRQERKLAEKTRLGSGITEV